VNKVFQQSVLWIWIGLLVLAAAMIIAAATWITLSSQLKTPLSSEADFSFSNYWRRQTPSESPMIVYGFAPYWNITNIVVQPELTHLSYFSLEIASDGAIVTRTSDGNAEPGARWMRRQEFFDLSASTMESGAELTLTVTQFDPEVVAAFLADEAARAHFFSEIKTIFQAYGYTGLIVDIEVSGTATLPDTVKQNLTTFMAEARDFVDSIPSKPHLGIAVYASAAQNSNLWDVAKIAPHIDFFVIMAYDYHRRSSNVAGPVAPIFGGRKLWDEDISSHLSYFLQIVPAQKLILGVPFYGYEWNTTAPERLAHTIPGGGATASYQRIQSILDSDTYAAQVGWDSVALSPYLTYTVNEEFRVIFYEDPRSLRYKLDLVEQLGLRGIAIWALGYEGADRALWNVIGERVVPTD
jgi:spore germination protein YaaH